MSSTPSKDASPSPPPPSTNPPTPATITPLFTEINIPLPSLPQSTKIPIPSTSQRPHRTLSLSALSLHHHRHSQSPRSTPEAKVPEAALMSAAMKTQVAWSRTQTLSALAVAPAVLMLSTELFTPGRGG